VSDDELHARRLEKDGVTAAEAGKYDVALTAFNSAIERCSTRASCYNNRAQLYRLQHKNEGEFGCLFVVRHATHARTQMPFAM
jgi:hypothetical protein